MSSPRTFRMTIAKKWYDQQDECAKEIEMHFKTARRGKIGYVRRYLSKRGVKFYQDYVYKETGKLIPKEYIRPRFEREEPATKAENKIEIQIRRMEYRGRQWKADRIPTRTIHYSEEKHEQKNIVEELQKEIENVLKGMWEFARDTLKRLFS